MRCRSVGSLRLSCEHEPPQRSCNLFPLLAKGDDTRAVQEPLAHGDVRTAMTYTHVLNLGGPGVRSPMDVLAQLPNEH